MSRSDSAFRLLRAELPRVFAAIIDPEALSHWLPPAGMTGRFEEYDARPGGRYRLVLSYREDAGNRGKTTAGSDVVEGRFVEIVPEVRVVQAVEFASEDPAFAGTMTVTWSVSAVDRGTLVEIRADGVPPGISPEDHAAGFASSLDNLEAFLSR